MQGPFKVGRFHFIQKLMSYCTENDFSKWIVISCKPRPAREPKSKTVLASSVKD